MKEIPVYDGSRQVYLAMVDDEDYEILFSMGRWFLSHGYAMNHKYKNGKLTRTLMHRAILGLIKGDGTCSDHINLNKLDNQKSNLRICSHADNVRNKALDSRNKTGYKGLHQDKSSGLWRAYLTLNYDHIFLGNFVRREDAAKAYNVAAQKHFGEFARLNDVPEWADENSRVGQRTNQKSGIKGISLDTTDNKWVVRLAVDGKRVRLGRYHSLEKAEAAVLNYRKMGKLT